MSTQTSPSNPGASAESDLAADGFCSFITAESKGHDFEIWLKAPAISGRRAWKAAVRSGGGVAYATAYVAEDGVMRASVPITEPRGHLLFRASMERGRPSAHGDFQCKFGAS